MASSGFRRYWRWKSRSLGGRPQIDADLRALIRRMSVDNPLWGPPRIHGELLKLGFEVAQSSVANRAVMSLHRTKIVENSGNRQRVLITWRPESNGNRSTPTASTDLRPHQRQRASSDLIIVTT